MSEDKMREYMALISTAINTISMEIAKIRKFLEEEKKKKDES